jgi:hypothetical protein
MGTRGFLRESLTITGEEHLLLPDKLLVVVVPTLITLIFSPTSTAVVLGLTLLLRGGVRCVQASNSCERQPEEEPLLPGGNTLIIMAVFQLTLGLGLYGISLTVHHIATNTRGNRPKAMRTSRFSSPVFSETSVVSSVVMCLLATHGLLSTIPTPYKSANSEYTNRCEWTRREA